MTKLDTTPSSTADSDEYISPFTRWTNYKALQKRFRIAKMAGLQPLYFLPHEGVNGAVNRHEGREVDNFAAYNYLGLSGDPRNQRASREGDEP